MKVSPAHFSSSFSSVSSTAIASYREGETFGADLTSSETSSGSDNIEGTLGPESGRSESFRVADSGNSEGFGSGRSEGFEVVASVFVGLVVEVSASVVAFSLKFKDLGLSGAVEETASAVLKQKYIKNTFMYFEQLKQKLIKY